MRRISMTTFLICVSSILGSGCKSDDVLDIDSVFNGSSELLGCEGWVDACPCECRFYVDGNTSHTGDGKSWATPFRKIQAGVNWAHCTVRQCTEIKTCDVWVAGQSRNSDLPPIDYSTEQDNRTPIATLRLRAGVHLYGGFDKTETSSAERWFLSDKINRNLSGPGVQSLSWLSYPSHTLERIVWAEGPSRIDGFLIAGGTMTAGADSDDYHGPIQGGAGLLVQDGNVEISNCQFESNGGPGKITGGALLVDGGSASLSDTTFFENSGSFGGAVAVWRGSLTIDGGLFHGNSAMEGGAIYMIDAHTLRVSNSIISNNHADGRGGAIAYDNFSTPDANPPANQELSIVNSVFYQNSADMSSAFSAPNFEGVTSTQTISNSAFINNIDSGNFGPSVESSASISNTVIWSDAHPPNMPVVSAKSVTYSVVRGGHIGEGNSSENPQISLVRLEVDPRFNTSVYTLRPQSPCIDAANSFLAPETDLVGHTRVDDPAVINRGIGPVDHIDIGAIEYTAQ